MPSLNPPLTTVMLFVQNFFQIHAHCVEVRGQQDRVSCHGLGIQPWIDYYIHPEILLGVTPLPLGLLVERDLVFLDECMLVVKMLELRDQARDEVVATLEGDQEGLDWLL